jgi:DNA-binding transcriptional MerR regulator
MADAPDACTTDDGRRYTIGELAREFKVTTRAIRFYESRHLLSPQRRGTARLYSGRDRARLMIVLRGKNLGFSLEEIAEYLELYDADPTQVIQLKHLKGKVDARIADLLKKRADVDRALRELKQIRSQVVGELHKKAPNRR